jgi:quinol monooxygenase YgiN
MLMKINRRTLLAGGAALAAVPCLVGEAVAEGIAKSHMPEEGIILTAMVKAKPGQEEAVKKVLVALVEPTRKEPGCLCYNLHQSKSDKAQFMFYEQWASKKALDTHANTPALKALPGRLKDKTETGGGVTFYELLK